MPAALPANAPPAFIETFAAPFQASPDPAFFGVHTDGIFKIDGDYCVPYGGPQPVCLKLANVAEPGNGELTLTIPANSFQGAEISTPKAWLPVPNQKPPFGPSPYGYGYYETMMKPSCVQGEISSFFWIQAPQYGPLELDVEFPNPPGHVFADVQFTVHPSGRANDVPLAFNPCQAFHRYGFLWTSGHIVFTVDGAAAASADSADLTTTATGFVMANAWTGKPDWGGGPPTQNAVNQYRWIRFLPAATQIPPTAPK